MFASVSEQEAIGTVRFRFRPRRGVKERDVEQHIYVQRVTLSDKKGEESREQKTLWRGIEKIMTFADGLRYARAHP